ncbi:F0F1 ATP synthase subunit gamma [candidate division WWE3 bacterium]|uniref:F0F1 ATP synthase subunit gamma n=1 Tax=candidate division WWE3 bacterium TaxID=2053526 RepID=A0A955LK31_UNCKA|nr:F0F1 ATP synthase subunit gamma [candidate division WWE3 bacterium]
MNSYRAYLNDSEEVRDVAETIWVEEKLAISDYHRLRKEVTSIKDYTNVLKQQLETFNVDANDIPIQLQRNEFGQRVLLAVGGEKGLVGDTHHRLLEKFGRMKTDYGRIYVIGRKMAKMMSESGIKVDFLEETSGNMSNVLGVAQDLLQRFISDKELGLDGPVDVLYPSFVSVLEYVPTLKRLLPPLKSKDVNQQSTSEVVNAGILYEPSKRKVFLWVLQRYMELALYEILIEAQLSILTARMISMENAASQAEEIAAKLRARYSKERKRVISQRQIEIFVAHSVIGG